MPNQPRPPKPTAPPRRVVVDALLDAGIVDLTKDIDGDKVTFKPGVVTDEDVTEFSKLLANAGYIVTGRTRGKKLADSDKLAVAEVTIGRPQRTTGTRKPGTRKAGGHA